MKKLFVKILIVIVVVYVRNVGLENTITKIKNVYTNGKAYVVEWVEAHPEVKQKLSDWGATAKAKAGELIEETVENLVEEKLSDGNNTEGAPSVTPTPESAFE